jgi:hypothetical protein
MISEEAFVAKKRNAKDFAQVLASSIYRQMQDEGFQPRDIISVSSQLIDMLTTELQKEDLRKS